MNIEQVKTAIGEIPKGANIVVKWERKVRTRKKVTDTITKSVRMVCRIGIKYDNLKSVRKKRDNGTLPAERKRLSGGRFEIYPYLIKHKGERYLRLYKGTSDKVFPAVRLLETMSR